MTEGQIVILCDTSQAGTVQWVSGEVACVLLRNGELFTGSIRMLRLPQSEEDLANTVIDVERLIPKAKKGKKP